MTDWVFPALVAPAILGLITVAGWFTTYYLNLRQERRKRLERVTDVQTALLAEIRSYLHRSSDFDLDEHGRRMEAWILNSKDNAPFVPLDPEFQVYAAILKDIHILPQPVIDPVVLFYTQASTLALFTEDLRADRYLTLNMQRKNDMYQDYLELLKHSYRLAGEAMKAIDSAMDKRMLQ